MTVSSLAQRLVSIPSHADPGPIETAIVETLSPVAAVTIEQTDAGIVARRKGGGSLALVCHHDVVPPADSQITGDGCVSTIRDDRLYGRGSADMKGALAGAIRAFCDTEQPCTLASFRGEEQGGVGVRRAIDAGFAPEYAIVCEGSTGYSRSGVTDVAVCHPGRRASTITTHGETAHASEPAAGTNAIYRASSIVDRLRRLERPTATVFGQELTGTLSVTEIDGGTAWNVVPDRCTLTVDERTVPGGQFPIETVTTEDWCEWTVGQALPPFSCDEETFAERVLDVAGDIQTQTPALVAKPHATDAGWLDDAGTTCLVCGPAEPGEAHTEDESVSLDALDRCYRLYRTLIERLSRTK